MFKLIILVKCSYGGKYHLKIHNNIYNELIYSLVTQNSKIPHSIGNIFYFEPSLDYNEFRNLNEFIEYIKTMLGMSNFNFEKILFKKEITKKRGK